MAYQLVGTPRFYVNALEWLSFNGEFPDMNEVFRTLPVKQTEFDTFITSMDIPYDLANPFCFLLGHSDLSGVAIKKNSGHIPDSSGITINIISGANPDLNGWSLLELLETPDQVVIGSGSIGSIIIGSYFDMAHSPDLNLTLSYDYSGTKTIETRGGASLSNSFYTKPPKWGELGAWELGQTGTVQNLSRSGRRIWDLSFSYLSDSAIFPATLNLATEADADYEIDTLNTGTDDFYGQVIHRCGSLPFVFSPDNSSTALDNFAICKFDSGFQFKQVANGVYNAKMKIREIW